MKRRLRELLLEGWRPYFWIAVAACLLYLKTLAFRFTYFDDNYLLQQNGWFIGDTGRFLQAFTRDVFMEGEKHFYRPVLTVSFMLGALGGSIAPLLHRLTNILLHAAASCFAFAFLRRFAFSRGLCFLFALLFAVHPALAPAVAWLPGRNDSLLAVFLFPSFIAFTVYLEGRRPRALAAHLLLFALALFTKESAAVFPFLCLLYAGTLAGRPRPAGATLPPAAGWAAVMAGWWLLKSRVTDALAPAFSVKDIVLSIVQYTGKALLPFGLTVYPVVRDTSLLYGIAALSLLAALLIACRGCRRGPLVFGGAWFLLLLLPPLFFPAEARLEHRLYVPLLGLFLVLAGLLRGLPSRFPRAGTAAGALALVLCAGTAFFYSDRYMNRLVFWKSAVSGAPHSSTAHNGLGLRYMEYRLPELAEREFRDSLRLNPNNPYVHVNLAIRCMDAGRFGEAKEELDRAKALNPGLGVLGFNYGRWYYQAHREQEAALAWERTIELDPDYLPAYIALAAYHILHNDRARFDALAAALRTRFNYILSPEQFAGKSGLEWAYER